MQKFIVNIKSSVTSFIKNRLLYVLNRVNDHPITKAQSIIFQLKVDDMSETQYIISDLEKSYSIPRQNLLFCNKSAGQVNGYQSKNGDLYSIEQKASAIFDFYKDGVFGFDIFETIFFHLSRVEEIELKFSEYLTNRFDFERQLALVRFGLEKVPVVDDLILAFIEILTGRKVEIKKEVSLSHDIDYIKKFTSPFSIFRKLAGHVRHRKSIKGLPYLWRTYNDFLVNGQDAFDTFDWMLSKKEVDKTIYFLMGGSHKNDNQYSLDHPTFKKALKLSLERNYKIGIHPSYESWNNIDLARSQKEKLEREVGEEIVVSRQHYLNFDILQTPEILQSLGIREDSSLGYTRYVGYRCGTGFPYLLYDFKNEKAFDVVEKPLVFMDSSWLYEYLRTSEFSLDFLENCNGVVNFHNSSFDEFQQRNIDLVSSYKVLF